MPEYMSDSQGTKVVDGTLHYSDTVEEDLFRIGLLQAIVLPAGH